MYDVWCRFAVGMMTFIAFSMWRSKDNLKLSTIPYSTPDVGADWAVRNMDLHLQRYPEIFALKGATPEHADKIIRHLTPVLS